MRTLRALIFGAVLGLALVPNLAGAQYEYERAIYDACARHGCDAEYVIAIMYCESGGDPGAVNPVTGDFGLMQINLSIWGQITDPYDQIEFTAEKVANGQAYLWLCP